MGISHINGVAAANFSHINGVAKANVTEINGITASFGPVGPVATFLAAAGIVDGTIEAALDALYASLLADGIWAKCYAIYPFVGGTSSTHSYNLKDPTLYQITWSGTVTHNANGITGNGSTGYGNTGLNASSVLTVNDVHLSCYSRTSASASTTEIGLGGALSGQQLRLYTRFSNLTISHIGVSASDLTPASADGAGFFVGTRRSTTEHEVYKNGSSLATSATSNAAANPLPSLNVFVLAENANGTAGAHSARNLAFATIGTGLTDAEVANFHTRVEAFQDALSRGVV